MPFAPTFLPADATWAGVLLLCIAGVFLAGIVIGTVARLVMPERYVELKPIHHSESAEEKNLAAKQR